MPRIHWAWGAEVGGVFAAGVQRVLHEGGGVVGIWNAGAAGRAAARSRSLRRIGLRRLQRLRHHLHGLPGTEHRCQHQVLLQAGCLHGHFSCSTLRTVFPTLRSEEGRRLEVAGWKAGRC